MSQEKLMKVKVMLLVKPREVTPHYRTLKMICDDKTIDICAVVVDEGKLDLLKGMRKYYRKRGLLRTLIKIITFVMPGDLGHRLEFEGTRRANASFPIRELHISENAVWIHTTNPYTNDIIPRLEELKPDIAFRASGFDLVKEPLLSLPKHGILSYHHDDLTRYRGGPPCLWEIYNNESEVGVTVQILADGLDKGDIVLQRFYKINYDISINRFVDKVKLDSADLAYQVIKQFQRGEFNPKKPASVGKFYTAPTARQLAILHLINIRNIIYGWFRRLVKRS